MSGRCGAPGVGEAAYGSNALRYAVEPAAQATQAGAGPLVGLLAHSFAHAAVFADQLTANELGQEARAADEGEVEIRARHS